ncbi:MAG: DUF192 domain-containing protein [Bdellovibrionales bacterium]|nr:DUF192 domain-containing protein [Bdellovibrionales bacterium]
MFQKSPAPYDGLFIPYSSSIHNCFVSFPIEVLFINKDGVIVAIIRNFRPWQISRPYFTARDVIELINIIPDFVGVGDKLILEEH